MIGYVIAIWSLPYGHRHTVTATWSPLHGHRHTVTATQSPPHGHRHTVTATRLLPHGYRHMATATRPQPPLAGSRAGLYTGSCAELCDKLCARLCIGTFNHGNSLRAFGLKVFSAALNPLVPTATPSFWPVAIFSLWLIPFVNHGQ